MLVVSLDTSDLRNAVARKALSLLSAGGSGINIGLNVADDRPVVGLVLDDQHFRSGVIELAEELLGKKQVGPVNVEFVFDKEALHGAKVNFKWGGK